MRVVVLGHARSGTSYAAHCFRRSGWDVRHEILGRDGIASWMWAVRSEAVPHGEPRTGPLDADVVLHLMRNPAEAVASIAYTEGITEDWRRQFVSIPEDAKSIERAVWSYLGWNRLIATLLPTHSAQLDQIEEVVESITGVYPDGASVYWYNSRPHQKLSDDQIEAQPWNYALTPKLWEKANAMYEEMAK